MNLLSLKLLAETVISRRKAMGLIGLPNAVKSPATPPARSAAESAAGEPAGARSSGIAALFFASNLSAVVSFGKQLFQLGLVVKVVERAHQDDLQLGRGRVGKLHIGKVLVVCLLP